MNHKDVAGRVKIRIPFRMAYACFKDEEGTLIRYGACMSDTHTDTHTNTESSTRQGTYERRLSLQDREARRRPK